MFNVQLPYTVKRNGLAHVAWCPALDVYSQGPSHKKAVKNLGDALRLFLMSCYERGTLDQVLRESGFRPAAPIRRASTKRAVSKGFDTLMVPLPFLVDTRRRPCLHGQGRGGPSDRDTQVRRGRTRHHPCEHQDNRAFAPRLSQAARESLMVGVQRGKGSSSSSSISVTSRMFCSSSSMSAPWV